MWLWHVFSARQLDDHSTVLAYKHSSNTDMAQSVSPQEFLRQLQIIGAVVGNRLVALSSTCWGANNKQLWNNQTRVHVETDSLAQARTVFVLHRGSKTKCRLPMWEAYGHWSAQDRQRPPVDQHMLTSLLRRRAGSPSSPHHFVSFLISFRSFRFSLEEICKGLIIIFTVTWHPLNALLQEACKPLYHAGPLPLVKKGRGLGNHNKFDGR